MASRYSVWSWSLFVLLSLAVALTARRPASAQVISVIRESVADTASSRGAAADSADDTAADATADTASAASDETGDGSTELVRERYPNRAIKLERVVAMDDEGNYVNHGPWKMWDEQGSLIAEGEYHYNQRHGNWMRIHSGRDAQLFSTPPYNQFSAPFVSKATMRDGELNGVWTITDAKQRKVSEWNFTSGQRNGKSTWYYPSGQKMREIDYRDGVIHGKLLEWTPSTELVTDESFEDGRRLCPRAEYYNDKQKKTETTMLNARLVQKTADDWWNAVPATYSKEGKDEKHGPWIAWYPNGQVQMQGHHIHDLQTGKFIWWYSNGQKMSIGQFTDGKPNGKFVWWHPNGQKQRVGEFVTGIPTGKWSVWATDGKLVTVEDHDDPQHPVERPTSVAKAKTGDEVQGDVQGEAQSEEPLHLSAPSPAKIRY